MVSECAQSHFHSTWQDSYVRELLIAEEIGLYLIRRYETHDVRDYCIKHNALEQ